MSLAQSPSREIASPREGHPRGLYTLFFTEMWERFSYYGMRALLVLFMVDQVRGGLGMDDKIATSIYGLYTAGVYFVSLPGGWLADRLLGAQRAVWYGGIIIAAGHFTLAIPSPTAFYLGLILVVTGTGLLKPNISAIVGELYPEGGARRDAGFSIYYMGINLGAFLGPFVCSTLGEKRNWHYGFAAAGVGMVLGLIQYRLSKKLLGQAGLRPGNDRPLSRETRAGLLCALTAIVVVVALGLGGVFKPDPIALARHATTLIVAVGISYFAVVLLFFGLDRAEKQRVGVIAILFLGAALFWAGFEQAGSSLNLFADRYTAKYLPWFDYEVPTGWFQSIGPILIIMLAPVMAALWVRLAQRNLDPSIPTKFGLGLILLALGFVVMAAAAMFIVNDHKVNASWLITTYFVHTVGELCLSPVGLSSVTKLAPRRLVGQMMGTWFLASSLGNLIAGRVAGAFAIHSERQMPLRFFEIAIGPALLGVLLILLAKPIKRWMVGVR
jgi:proton-dependent oligopeptide transporter, POT family